MRAYSYDLRTHLLRAIDQGMPKPEAARFFGVSTRTIERYQQRRRETGDVVRRPIPGRRRHISPAQDAELWAQMEPASDRDLGPALCNVSGRTWIAAQSCHHLAADPPAKLEPKQGWPPKTLWPPG